MDFSHGPASSRVLQRTWPTNMAPSSLEGTKPNEWHDWDLQHPDVRDTQKSHLPFLCCITAALLFLLKMEKVLLGCFLMLGQLLIFPAGARERPQARFSSRGRHVRMNPQTALLGERGVPAAAGSGVSGGGPWTRAPGLGRLLPLCPLLAVLVTHGIPLEIGASGLWIQSI